jgi:hypothetical protein
MCCIYNKHSLLKLLFFQLKNKQYYLYNENVKLFIKKMFCFRPIRILLHRKNGIMNKKLISTGLFWHNAIILGAFGAHA